MLKNSALRIKYTQPAVKVARNAGIAVLLAVIPSIFFGLSAHAIEFSELDHYFVKLSPDQKYLRIQAMGNDPYTVLKPHWKQKGDCIYLNISKHWFGKGLTTSLDLDLPISDKIQTVRFGDGKALIWRREDKNEPASADEKPDRSFDFLSNYRYPSVTITIEAGSTINSQAKSIESKQSVVAGLAKKLEPVLGNKVSDIRNAEALRSVFKLTVTADGKVRHVEILEESTNSLFNACARSVALETIPLTNFGGLPNDTGREYNGVTLTMEKEPNLEKTGVFHLFQRNWNTR